MDQEMVSDFVEQWLNAWNAHDIDAILSHYNDDFCMTSPIIAQLANDGASNQSCTLNGKINVKEYWLKALSIYPDLQFNVKHVFAGVNSVTIVYEGVSGNVAEVFNFSSNGKVGKAHAYYENT